MVDTRALAQVIILNELMDSDDEKPHRGKTRRWVKRRSDRGYFNNIMKELRFEDCTDFRDMFRMDVADLDYILTQISMLLALFFLPCLACSCLCSKIDFYLCFDCEKNIQTLEIRSTVDVLHSAQC